MNGSSAATHFRRAAWVLANIGAVLLGSTVLVERVWSQARARTTRWVEKRVGNLPKEYGQFVTAVGTNSSYALFFRGDAGQVRILQLEGGSMAEIEECKFVTRSD